MGLANLSGTHHLRLRDITMATNTPLSTCSDIMHLSVLRIPQTHLNDPCSEENLCLKPTTNKGDNQLLSSEEKARVLALALQDATHCRKPLRELISESGVNICSNTLSNILSSDRIYQCRPTKKPFLNTNAKVVPLAWVLKYLHFDFRKVLFTDKSQFEVSTFRSAHVKGVFR